MKNITITLPDAIARRTRIQAARAEKSVSRFIADLLADSTTERPHRQTLQCEAIEGFLASSDIDGFDEPTRTLRDHIYAVSHLS